MGWAVWEWCNVNRRGEVWNHPQLIDGKHWCMALIFWEGEKLDSCCFYTVVVLIQLVLFSSFHEWDMNMCTRNPSKNPETPLSNPIHPTTSHYQNPPWLSTIPPHWIAWLPSPTPFLASTHPSHQHHTSTPPHLWYLSSQIFSTHGDIWSHSKFVVGDNWPALKF